MGKIHFELFCFFSSLSKIEIQEDPKKLGAGDNRAKSGTQKMETSGVSIWQPFVLVIETSVENA